MPKRFPIWILAFSLSALSVTAQDVQSANSPGIMGTGIGRFITAKTETPGGGTPIFVKEEVATDSATHLQVISHGNSLLFAPNSKFEAGKNEYKLESGGSKVATYTGMTAHLPDCFSVTPVKPYYMTLFEVNWSGSTAYVYARFQDVKINYWMGGSPKLGEANPRKPDRDWIVKEGHTARIDDVRLCRPFVYFWPNPNLPTALELAGTTAVVTSEPFWPWPSSKPNMSPDHP